MDPELLALLERIGELSDTELTDLEARLRAEGERLADEPVTAESVDALEALAGHLDTVTAAVQTRTEEAAALADRRAAALARTNPPEDTTGDTEDDGEQDDDDSEEPAEEPTARTAAGPRGRPAPARRPSGAAMTRAAGRPAGRGAAGSTSQDPPAAGRATIVAAADTPGFAAGQEIADAGELARAVVRRLDGVRRSAGGDGDQVIVASVQHEWPVERQLGEDNLALNMQRIDAVSSQEAIVAAGGLCAPLENLYDVPTIGVVARPVRDALVGYQAARGGIQYRVPPQLPALVGSASVWTMQNDIDAATAGAPDPVKPCLDVVCPGVDTATVEAVTSCLTFRNIAARFDPEMVAANVRLANVAHARLAENTLLTKLIAESKTLTYAKKLGVVRDTLGLVDHLAAYHRNRYRLDGTIQLRYLAPRWLLDMMLLDMARATHNSEMEYFAVQEARILGWFQRRGITPVFHLDGTAAETGPPALAAQFYATVAANAAVPEFPDTASVHLWTEGEFLFLDGGSLDIGVVRDSALVQTNAYKQFMETFEGLAGMGQSEAYRVIQAVEATGTSAAPIDISAFDD